MIVFFAFVMAILVLFIDHKELENGSKRDKGIYFSILGVFVLMYIFQSLDMEIRFPFEWVFDKVQFIKRFYQFLGIKG